MNENNFYVTREDALKIYYELLCLSLEIPLDGACVFYLKKTEEWVVDCVMHPEDRRIFNNIFEAYYYAKRKGCGRKVHELL